MSEKARALCYLTPRLFAREFTAVAGPSPVSLGEFCQSGLCSLVDGVRGQARHARFVWTKSPRADSRTHVRSLGLLCKCTVLRGQPVYNVPATDLCLKIDSRPPSVHPSPGAGVLLFRFFVSRARGHLVYFRRETSTSMRVRRVPRDKKKIKGTVNYS